MNVDHPDCRAYPRGAGGRDAPILEERASRSGLRLRGSDL